jgi:hypothetical protein
MQPQDIERKTKPINITFPDASGMPVLYVNAVKVLPGPSEFFVTLGTVIPPEIRSLSDFENIDHLSAQPLIQFAMSPVTMKQFIDVLTQQYEQFKRATETQAASSGSEGVKADE